jgi:hypothetical protein
MDAENYLNSFRVLSIGTPLWGKNKGHILLDLPQSQISSLDANFQFKGENDTLNWLQVILQMNPRLAQIIKPYSLSQVFSTYGQPAEVLVFTDQVVIGGHPHPLSLVVFYPEHGFMIEYVVDAIGQPPDANLKGCMSLAFPYFWFWSPSEEITLKDVVSWISGYQLNNKWLALGKFKTIEEATGMSITDLYTLYTTNPNACITTPAEIWPMP